MSIRTGVHPFKISDQRNRRRLSLFRTSHALVAAVQMLTLCSVAQAAPPLEWKGKNSTDWNTSNNWDPHNVPTNSKDATIDDISPNATVLSTRGAAVDDLIVGDSSTGSLTIRGSGTLTSSTAILGNDAGGIGTITLSSNVQWTNSGALSVGKDGDGNLNISNGSLANVDGLVLGDGLQGDGIVTVDHAQFTNAGSLTIGNDGDGTVNIQNGASATSQFVTMSQSSMSQGLLASVGSLTVTGMSTDMTIVDHLTVGSAGPATLSIAAGGYLNVEGTSSVNSLIIGDGASANGTAAVTGANSLLNNDQNLIIGNSGVGTLTISNNADVQTATMSIANRAGSTGTLNIGAASGAAVTPGTLEASGITMGSGAAVINFDHNSNSYVFTPVVTGNGTVNILAGTSIFTGNSTYSGLTKISPSATLQLGGSLGNGATGAVTTDITDNGTLIFDRNNTVTLSSVISGTGVVQQIGTGTTILTANNTYTGLTTISSGTLQLGNLSFTGLPGTGAVIDNSVLAVNRSNVFALGNTISGTGQFIQLGTGVTALSANNTYTGNTTISAGTLQLGINNTTGSVAGPITDNSILAVLRTNSLTLSQVISGSGELQQLGTGTTILTANNTYTGITTISAGTLQLGNGTATGAIIGDITIANNAGLVANRIGTLTLPGMITGMGTLTQAGTGTTILTANNDYSGGTTITAGTLQLGDGHLTGSVAGAIINSGVLAVNHSNTVTFSNSVIGSGQFQQLGTGTTILATNNSFTGLVTISGGTLQLGNGGTSGSLGTSNVLDNSLLTIKRTDLFFVLPNAISGTGQFNQVGTGTTILTADSNYSGGTTISAGTLQLGNGSTTGSVTGNILDESILALNHSGVFTVSNTISDTISHTGQLQQLGTGTTILTGDNTYTGNTVISGGTLQLGNAGITGSLGAGAVIDNSALAVNHTDTATLLGTISGTGTFAQIGTGTTLLIANNSYTGNTTISAGTLQLGNGGTSGSVAGNITDNANLTFDRSDNVTFSNVISGSGSVTKVGPNTLTIATNQTYTGGTNVNQGNLAVNATMDSSVVTVNAGATLSGTGIILGTVSITSDVDIGGGGHLSPGTPAVAGTLTTDSLILSPLSQLDFQLGTANEAGAHDPGNDLLEVNGNLTLNGQLNITGAFGGAGTYRLIDYTGTLTDNGLTMGILPGSSVPSNFIVQIAIPGEVNLIVQTSGTGTQFWDGANTTANGTIDGGSGTWNDSATNTNWTISDGSANGLWNSGFAIFQATPGTVTVDSGSGPVSATGMQFAVDGYLVQGASITLSGEAPVIEVGDGTPGGAAFTATIESVLDGTGTVTKTGLGTLVLTGTNIYTGGTVISQGTLQIGNGGNTGSISGSILNDAALVFDRSDDITYADPVSGTGSLTKLGAGTLTLTNNNTYTGGTTITAGALQIGNDGTSGSIAGDIVDNASLIFNRSDNLTYDGAISGTGSMTKLGAGTLTLIGNNAYTGGTTITAGTLQIGNAGTSGTVTGDILDNAALVFNRRDDITYGNVISGTGSMAQIGPDTLTLTGNNTYTGGTTISEGTLQIGNGGTSGSVAGNILDNAALVFNRSDIITYGNVISGTGSVSQLGTGTLTLTANNTYTGGTTVSAGTLQIGNGSTTGSVAGNILDNASLVFNRSDNITYGNVISGSGSVTQLGAGMLTLTSANTYTGGTTISAGILQIGNGGTTGGIAGDIVDNASLVFNRSDDVEYDGGISGSGSLSKLGAGTLILTGNNTYAGGSTITAGTLQIGNAGNSGSITGNILDNASLVFNRSDDITYANVISGTGSMTQLGAGTLTLTGNNDYAGGTTITAGTLQIGNAGTSGSVAGDIVNNAALVFDRSDDIAYAGVISGTGSMTQVGAGTLTLTGNNTYTGGTTVSAGILQIGNAGTSGSVAGDIVNNTSLVFDRSDSIEYDGVISGTGSVAQVGAGTLTLTGNNTYAGGTTISAGTLQIGNGGTSGNVAGDIVNNASLIFNRSDDVEYDNVISGSGSLTQLGAGTLTLGNENTYTGGTTISSGTLQIGNGGTTGSVTGNILDNAALVFDHEDDVTFANVISGTGSVTQLGTGTLTLTNNNTYTGGTTVSSGTLQIGNAGTTGSVTGDILNNAAVVFNRSDNVEYAGVISGSGSLTQLGAGILTLTGNNTYTGDTTISAGALQIGNAGTSGSITGDILNNASLIFNRSDDIAYGNVISGTGSVAQLGTGTLTLTGNNTYAGGTTISAGTLQIGNGSTSGSVAGDILDNAALVFNRSNNFTYANAISGTGSMSKLGAGTLTLTNDNTYAGGTTISAGTLQIGNGGITGSVAGNIVDNASLVFNRSDDVEYDGGISGSGSLSKLGEGTLTLTGNNTYAGDTMISAGTLQIGSGGTSGGVAGDIVNNAALVFNRSDDITYAGLISGSGNVTKMGAGMLTLSNDSTYTGGTTISGGTLQLGSGGISGSVAGNILDNAAVVFNRSDDIAYGNVISGTGSMTQLGAGTLTLTGNNTYTGDTTISAGTLQIGNGGTSGSVVGNIVNNAALIFNRTNNISYGNVISGSGSVAQLGAGTLTLTGNNTYAGDTTISAGTLQLGDGGTSGSVAGNILDNAAVVFNRSDDITYANVISGTGSMSKLDGGTLTLTGNNAYTGGTTISGGTLQIGNAGTSGSVAGNIVDNAALVFDRSDDLTYAGGISGSGSVAQVGAGTLILTGNNTYTGGTTVSTGTLQIGNGGTSGSVTGDILDNAAVAFNRSDDITYANVVSGTGQLQQLGTGTTILTGDNTYTGNTTISAGTLQLGNAGITGSLGAGAVIDNSALAVNHTDTATLLGTISGTGTFAQIGTGTTLLIANNSYTGNTTISAGTLQLGNGGTTGSVAGNITDNANLTFDRSDNATYSNVISGTGSLTKVGPNTLTIATNQTYTGGTNVNQGELAVNATMDSSVVTVNAGATLSGTGIILGTVSITSDVDIGGGGHLSPGTPAVAGTLTTDSLILSPLSQLDFQLGTANAAGAHDPGNDLLEVNGDLTLNGQLNISGAVINDGTYRLIDYTGALTNNGLTLGILPGSSVPSNFIVQTSIAGEVNLIVQSNGTGTQFWDGANTTANGTIDGGSGTWNDSATNTNWTISDGSANGLWNSGFAIFQATPGTVTVDSGSGPVSATGMQFAVDGYLVQGASITLSGEAPVIEVGDGTPGGAAFTATIESVLDGTGTVTKTGLGTLVLTGTNIYTGGTVISQGTLQIGNGGNTGSISGSILNDAALVFDRSDDITYADPVSGTGSLTKLGAGTLTLTNNNTYTGGTTITAGALQIGNDGTSGSIAGDIVDNASLIFNRSDNLTYDGAISGTGSMTKLGAGTLTLIGNNAYTGGTTITAGTLQIGNAGTSGTVTGDILDNAALVFNRRDDITYGNVISGTGSMAQIGPDTLTLTGNNTYTGGTTISEGTLQIGNGGTSGSVAGNILDNAALVFNRSDIITYGNVISGTGSVSQLGTGTLTLTANNTYTGGTTVSAGTLQIGNGSTTGSVAGNILDNASLVFNRSDNITYGNVISGSGSVTQLGAGMLTLTSANTYTGGTTISAGILQIGNGGTTGGIAGDIVDNASLVFNRSDDVEYDGGISGSGSLSKLGAGTLILTGNNTYAGGSTITAGTLQIGNAGNSGSITGNILDNASLVFNRSDDITYANVISGTGSMTQLGAGTLTLTGNNDYAGGTTITAGTLQIGNAGTSGSVAGDIVNNAALVFDRSDDIAYAGVISGTGSMTQVGAGTLTLTGNNTYTGGTTVSAGILQIGNAGTSGSVAGDIVNNTSLVFDRSDSIEYDGVISGTGSVAQVGAGTLTLTGNNTYAGGTTISAGTLQIGNGGTSGNVAGDIVNNASLIFNRSDDVEYDNVISGSGSLTQLGAGTLTLGNENTYTGGTTISSGTLQIGNGGTTGSVTGNILDNAALVFDHEDDVTFANVISGTGSVTQLGTGTLTLTNNNTYTGGTTVSSGTLQIGNAGTTGSVTGDILNNAAVVFNRSDNVEYAGVISGSGSLTQLGAGILTLTGNNTYTGDTTISAGALQIGNAGTSGSITGDILNNASLIFNRSDDIAYGNVISGTGSVAQLGTGTLTLTGNNTYAGGTTISAGTLQIGNGSTSGSVAGDILDNAALVFNRSNNFTYANAISGTGSMSKLGAGTLTLTNDNTYAGGTTISAGTLQIGNGGTTGSIAGNIVDNAALIFNRSDNITFNNVISGSGTVTKLGPNTITIATDQTYTGPTTISDGTLQLGNAGASGSVGTGAVTNNSVLSVNRSDTLTLPGTISGTGQFTQLGTGTTTLTANNTYTGNTTISAGTLELGGNTTTGSVAGAITDNSILAVLRTNSLTLSRIISGSGQLQQLGTGTTILAANNTYTGITTISAGTLQLGNAGASGSLSTGAVTDNAVLAVNRSDVFALGNNISGSGQFMQLGTGVTVLSTDDTYTGNTTISAGTLQLGFNNTTGSVAGPITDNSILAVFRTNSLTLSQVISGSGELQQLGTGTTILSTDDTFTGLTTISGGTLQLGSGGISGSLGTGAVLDNSLLTVNRTNTLTLPNAISGTGQFNQIGTGTVILTADNTYTGNTTIAAGTLQLGNGNTTGSVAGNITDNSILALNHSNSLTLSGVVSGSGQLQQLGTGTSILAGNNTYTGTTTISAGTLQLGNGGTSGSLSTSNVLDNSLLTVNRTDALTLPNAISGTGQFNQIGTGTTIFTANNTYTGGTTITAGTLQLGDGHTTGSVADNITDNANLTFNRHDDVTFNGEISGTGTVTKLGLGTLTFTQSQTYTGQTTVDEGILHVDGTLQSSGVLVNAGATLAGNGNVSVDDNVTISDGAQITPGTLTTAGTLATNSLVLSQLSQLNFVLGTANAAGANDPSNDLLIVNGNLTLNGQLNITGAFGGDGIYRLIDYTGTLTNDGLTMGILPGRFVTSNFLVQTAIPGEVNLLVQTSGTGTQFWDGANTTANGTIDGGSGTWNNSAANTNWTIADGTVNGPWISGFAIFDATPGTVTVDSGSGPVSATGMQFAVDGYTVQGASITLSGDAPVIEVGDGTANGANFTATIDSVLDGTGAVTKTGLGTLVLTGTNIYTGGTVISQGILQIGNGSNTGSISGSILDDAALVFDRSDDITYADPISGTGSLTKLGAGTLTLTGQNIYTGGTTISDGTLQIGNGGTSGSITEDILDNASLVFNRSDNLTYDGAISGTGSMTKLGAGTLTLTGNNAYTGGTTISAGTLQIGNAETIGSITGDVIDNAALVFNRRDDITYANVISGSGTVAQVGPGTLTLTGNNTYTGDTTISAGTLQIGDGGTSGSVAGNIVDNTALIFNRSDTITYANVISGSGSVSQLGAGTLILTGNNVYTGGTTISSGTLQLGDGGTTGSVAGNILDNTSLVFNRSDDAEYDGAISGTGRVTQLGAGMLTLTSANTYTGGTTISAGILQIGNGGTTGGIAGDIVDNASLVFNRSDDVEYDGGISGSGSLSKLGAGTLTLTGNNTYTGGTTISSGTLQIGNAGTSGNVTGNILDNASLVFNRSDDITYANIISGTGSMTQLGAGTLTLTGNNDYAGGTTITAGTLQIGNAGTSGSVAGDIVNNAALVFDRSDDIAYAGVISGTGSMTQLGAGTLILTGNNTYTGGTTVSAGTLQIGNAGTSGSVAGDIVNNTSLVFDRSDSIEYDGVISGTGSVAQVGAGTLTLTGNNTYAGGTTISAGTLQIGNGGTSGNVAGNIVDNASLAFNRSDDVEYDDVISGSGSLTQLGAGTLTLGNENTYTGGTTISSGTLQIGNGGTTGSVTGNILDNAALVFDHEDDVTFANVISGTGSLTQEGNSVLILTSANTYTGATFVPNGTLQINGSINSNTMVNPRGTLAGTGTIFGNVQNSGIVTPGTPGTNVNNIGTLTIAGNYVGSGGQLVIRGVFGGDSSRTDKLVLSGGNASGDTQINLVNIGGEGAQTHNGIPIVVTKNSATTNADAFTLQGGSFPVGNYIYSLVRGGINSVNDWVLQSTKNEEVLPETPTGVRPEASLYSVVPAIARYLGLVSLGTYYQRQGDQPPLPGVDPAAWGRIIAEHTDHDWSGDVSPSFDGTIYGFQAGLDLYTSVLKSGASNHFGIFAAYADAEGGVSGLAFDKRSDVGDLNLQATSGGIYYTYVGASGWYIDTAAMGSWYHATPSSDEGLNATIDGAGMSLSVQGGYPIKISPKKIPTLVFEPQAQIVYQYSAFGNSHDADSDIGFSDGNAFTARIGGRLQVDCPVNHMIVKPYAIANLWESFGQNDQLFLPGSSPIQTKNGSTSLELGLGIATNINSNVSVYGGGSYIFNLDGNTVNTFFGEVGVRVAW